MALYTILFGISIFMIALVITIIKKMFFHWKHEHIIERTTPFAIERPAVSVMIHTSRCLFQCRHYSGDVTVYDIISKNEYDE
ncbi:unnamed protein product [Parnassius mnemosyne]|uniref:Uncharacterized protein n=1 Tax=Parnassius mnemosyne TaxID=213953 RepID=A0AAV1LBL6_9NEOP